MICFTATGSGEYAISIPRFVICGSGSSKMHYEYEITINLEADKWTIMRRYSRFREMHLAMKRKYGDAVRNVFTKEIHKHNIKIAHTYN